MKSNLYIPKTIKIGFQKRDDTFTGKLAYVIYTDDKGVLRKEKSWQSWCDAKIKALDFDNEPVDGFMINKDVQRYNWSHFSSNRSYIRIHDPRGFEFEISPENLIGILMSGNCDRRVLQGKFVYSWAGTELVLLPEVSESYLSSVSFTKVQAKEITKEDLKPGFIYRTKQMEEFVYLGKLVIYDTVYDYTGKDYERHCKREKKKGKRFVWSSLTKEACSRKPWEPLRNYKISDTPNFKKFAECISDTPHPDFASMYERYSKLEEVQKIVGSEIVPNTDLKSLVSSHNEYSNTTSYLSSNNIVVKDPRPNANPEDFLYISYNLSLENKKNYIGCTIFDEQKIPLISLMLARKVSINLEKGSIQGKTIYNLYPGFKEDLSCLDMANKSFFDYQRKIPYQDFFKIFVPAKVVFEYEGGTKVVDGNPINL